MELKLQEPFLNSESICNDIQQPEEPTESSENISDANIQHRITRRKDVSSSYLSLIPKSRDKTSSSSEKSSSISHETIPSQSQLV